MHHDAFADEAVGGVIHLQVEHLLLLALPYGNAQHALGSTPTGAAGTPATAEILAAAVTTVDRAKRHDTDVTTAFRMRSTMSTKPLPRNWRADTFTVATPDLPP